MQTTPIKYQSTQIVTAFQTDKPLDAPPCEVGDFVILLEDGSMSAMKPEAFMQAFTPSNGKAHADPTPPAPEEPAPAAES